MDNNLRARKQDSAPKKTATTAAVATNKNVGGGTAASPPAEPLYQKVSNSWGVDAELKGMQNYFPLATVLPANEALTTVYLT